MQLKYIILFFSLTEKDAIISVSQLFRGRKELTFLQRPQSQKDLFSKLIVFSSILPRAANLDPAVAASAKNNANVLKSPCSNS